MTNRPKLKETILSTLKAFFSLIIAVAIVSIAIAVTGTEECITTKVEKKDKYDELEFAVIHRPQITYFVDLKYLLCFATRKPDYKDLVQFHCPERMWKEAEETLQNKKTNDR